jgi:preprotein translocase subunit SecY
MAISLISAAVVALMALVPYLLLLLAWVAHTLWSGVLVIGSVLIFLVVDVPKQLLQKRKSKDSIPD